MRRADTGNHVLALSIHQKLTIELILARRWVAGKGNAGRAVVPHIPKHHGLNIDRCSPFIRDIVQPSIGFRARGLPGPENGGDGAPKLFMNILRERMPHLLGNAVLILLDHIKPMIRRQGRIADKTIVVLKSLKQILEERMIDAEHDICIHLNEAAIGIIGKSTIPCPRRNAFHRFVVEAEIKDSIHHPRHRGARA
ncbi:hypothetical protein MnTg02_01383 [bacterium MnTg02]|nr:hypothetical protein MnTg02_01383 [bacterium MnTg02]